ncbi:MAG: GNAT family protein [Polyangiales bacterium]
MSRHTIRQLHGGDAAAYRALRLRGLRDDPTAFARSYEDEREVGVEEFARRLDGPNTCVFGAHPRGEPEALAGIAGITREPQARFAHKVVVWGVYVAPEHRGGGVARALVTECVRRAFAMPGVRQAQLRVNAANAAANALYASLGFAPFGVERASMIVDGVAQDEVHMALFRPT